MGRGAHVPLPHREAESQQFGRLEISSERVLGRDCHGRRGRRPVRFRSFAVTTMPETSLPAQLFDGRSLVARRVFSSSNRSVLACSAPRPLGCETGCGFLRACSAPRFVALPNGWEPSAGPPRSSGCRQPAEARGHLARASVVAVLAVLATLAGVMAFYFFGVPRGEAVAMRISPERGRIRRPDPVDAR